MSTTIAWLANRLLRFRDETEAGQGLAEYGLILGLVAILCVGALSSLQGAIASSLGTMTSQF